MSAFATFFGILTWDPETRGREVCKRLSSRQLRDFLAAYPDGMSIVRPDMARDELKRRGEFEFQPTPLVQSPEREAVVPPAATTPAASQDHPNIDPQGESHG